MSFKIVAISGPAGGGKDEVGKVLVRDHGFKKEALADPMRDIFALATGIPVHKQAALKNDPELAPKYRRVMQMLGTEVFRDEWSQSVWIDNLKRRVYDAREAGFRGVVITDARFVNEIEALYLMDATLVHLDTNETWKRCPPPKSRIVKWLGERWPNLVYRWTQNPYYHPSEAETRRALANGMFQLELWNGGHTVVHPDNLERVYESTPEQIAKEILGNLDSRIWNSVRRE